MYELAKRIEAHLDAIFACYVFCCVIGTYAWWRTRRWSLEVTLFALSMLIMPLVYLAMFQFGMFRIGSPIAMPAAMFAAIVAPQSYALIFIACCSFWSLLKKSPTVSIIIALSFVINLAGYAWTRIVLANVPSSL